MGTGHPDHDHVARALARDAVDRAGTRRALGPRGSAAGHRRAGGCRWHRGSADQRVAVGRCRARPTRCAGPRRWPDRRRDGRRGRVDDHGRVPRHLQAGRRRSHRRHRRRGRLAPGEGHRHGRSDGLVRDHAPGRTGAGIGVTGPGARRPGRSTPVLRRARRRRDHLGRLVVARRPRGRAGTDGDGPGDRLPARPRPGDPVGHRDLHLARRTEWPADQGPPRSGASADPGHGDLRQDRDLDQGRASSR